MVAATSRKYCQGWLFPLRLPFMVSGCENDTWLTPFVMFRTGSTVSLLGAPLRSL